MSDKDWYAYKKKKYEEILKVLKKKGNDVK